MPEISRFYGITIYMFYNEHNPPHFHAEYQDYHVVIEIKSGKIRGKLPGKILNVIYDWMDIHRDELLDNWE